MRLIAALLLAAIVTITLPDGSAYNIELVSSNGSVWVYAIDRVAGKDLSHWVLDLGLCNVAVVSTDPPSSFGVDPTTGATGYKFEPIVNQTALYTITLDGEYPTGTVTATMKAGPLGNFASGLVAGPDCGEVAAPTVTPTATATGTATPTATATRLPTITATATITGDVPQVPTVDPTVLTPASTATETATPTTMPTATDVATPTVTPTTTNAVTGEGGSNEPMRWRMWIPWGGKE